MRTCMKNVFIKSLSALLAFLSVFGLMVSLSMIPVLAADDTAGGNANDDGSKESVKLAYDEKWTKYYIEGKEVDEEGNETDADFYTSEEKRLEAMGAPYITDGDFALYVDKITGEVAIKDKSTGDILFTNPYDIASSKAAAPTKMELMSQVYIRYTENGNDKEYYSFNDSALLGQIDIKRLSGGIRIEYSIGEEESRTLVPRWIEKSSFEAKILDVMKAAFEEGERARKYLRLRGYYVLFDPNDPATPDSVKQKMYRDYPVTADGMALYVFDENSARRELKVVESYIKEFCPEYTYEQLDADHALTKYEATNLVPANFRMALEYTLTPNGVEVRFPANGLRFDESVFQLTTISILQYMGAGSNDYEGYSMLPDGAGTLIRFEDVKNAMNLTGKLYGQDYAYQEIGNANQEVYRMPVFGVVRSNVPQAKTTVDNNAAAPIDDTTGGDTTGDDTTATPPVQPKKYSSGYLAIVTEGDALTNITSTHGGSAGIHKYNSCYPSFYPRPKDSYNLAEAISIGSNTTYTVVSERKYTGSYRIRYIMLTDSENKENRNADRTYYDASYVGMAKAYRDYLLKEEKVIDRLTDADVKEDIPLYIESFGVTETDETFLSIPITVKKALTSFENMMLMTKELKGEILTPEEICELMGIDKEEYDRIGMTPEKYQKQTAAIKNINFRLIGFTNGGMLSTVPTKVKFEKVTGGNKGYKDFLTFAAEHDVGVYPDFDFAYMSEVSLFDGFRYKRDAVKTIDNRYISKRSYDAVLQSFTVDNKICISASVFRDYFEKFNASMTKILDGFPTGISVGTLGSDLNSDFDEDDPYNREDSKVYTEEMLSQISSHFSSVIIDSGNAYAVPYADVILNVALDSSRYLNASESIPFFGMVYHGFVVFAGKPTNMAGDVDYEMLKVIENGATLYMMLSYDNVELLKEDPVLSKYYAISYEIWKGSLLTQYNEDGSIKSVGVYDKLNNALKDVQTSTIDDHKFLCVERELSDVERAAIDADATRAHNADKAVLQADLDLARNRLSDFEKLLTIYDINDAAANANLVNILKGYGYVTKDDAITDAKVASIRDSLDDKIEAAEKALADVKTVEAYKAEYESAIETTVDDGSVVYVKYSNGHWFVLNYNDFGVNFTVNGVSGYVGAKDYFDSNVNA